jgi:zinc protease
MLTTVLALALSAAPPQASPLSLTSESLTLDNGMIIIAAPDHSVPGVALDIWYRVGSRDEEKGRTGFAHLFEHLMFMGARHAPYPRFDSIMEAAGGVNNASTSQDFTNYYEIGPSNLLETFFWLEADRLSTLDRVMTDEKLKSQRLIVQNERRQSYENRPYGMADLAVEEQLFPAGHPYSWTPIGSHADLEAATLNDVVTFFRTWYVPNNAVLTVVGDVEPARVFELAKKYLSFIPKKALPAKKTPVPAALAAEKRVAMTDKVEAPKLIVAWQSPRSTTVGDAECDLLSSILTRGKASRLYQRLVHTDQIATSVQANQGTKELGGTFLIEAVAAPGHTTKELLAAIDDELKKLTDKGPTKAELDAARARLETDFATGLQDLRTRAMMLARYQVEYGSANSLQTDLERYTKATTESVTATAKAVLVPGRLVVEVTPEAAPTEAPKSKGGAK